MTLALPAPARFKLSRSIKVPTVKHWSWELTQLTDPKSLFYGYLEQDQRTLHIADARRQLDFAEWIVDYTATHDCKPTITRKREDWHSRTAQVQVEDTIYNVQVARGRRVRIAFKPRGQNNGFHWNLYVTRDHDSARLVNADRCPKSEGLGAAAVRQHLVQMYCATRGIKGF